MTWAMYTLRILTLDMVMELEPIEENFLSLYIREGLEDMGRVFFLMVLNEPV